MTWKPKLGGRTMEQVEDLAKDPRMAPQNPDQSVDTTDPAGSELRGKREQLYGVPLSKEEAIRKQQEKRETWYYNPDQNTIVGPDGVVYSGVHYDTPEFREKVEQQSPAVDTSQLSSTGRLIQRVVIEPGQFEVVFCTLCPAEVYELQKRRKTADWADLYKANLDDLFASMREIVGKRVIGDESLVLEDPIKMSSSQTFEFDKEQFEKNLEVLSLRLPQNVISILLPQYVWFRSRIDAFLLPTNLGNS